MKLTLENDKFYDTFVSNGKIGLYADNKIIILGSSTFNYNEEMGYMCDYDPKSDCDFEDIIYLKSGNCIGCGSKLLKNKLGD